MSAWLVKRGIRNYVVLVHHVFLSHTACATENTGIDDEHIRRATIRCISDNFRNT